jgi:hypothetical protein
LTGATTRLSRRFFFVGATRVAEDWVDPAIANGA